ncbi:hypothetical protein HYDPIDRAFT_114667 [Hydnomerulius pinastri MD-312]|uniref:Uncharacterized protein n=1 Tax=Hydnomerulius pinastri MD-312 TaxID=994086 RepID=A0A0C9V5I7_9AGAM|nr:hypothetical protein HYDPIDRAFT_116880 [Hydnomerulius pinastri MD-312]KIJ62210.1 hypothetical protein HYDPIDRAFT_114667 [Hydnomerulius pinastri MD-312]
MSSAQGKERSYPRALPLRSRRKKSYLQTRSFFVVQLRHVSDHAAHNHMHHYYKNGQESRLDQAIREFKHAVDRCPGRSAALSNLATAKFISCQAREAHLDLDEPISLFREALDLRPPHDPDHPCTLINLSIALLAREPRRRLMIRQAR